MRPVFRPVSRNFCLSAALVTGLGGLLLPGAPALALGSCTEGLAVITPDGQNATILPEAANGDGKTCAVRLASGSETQVPVDLLMPDFGEGEEETEVAAVKGDAPLVTGYYSCGADDALQLEILDGGKYADADGNEGRFARADDGKVTFLDGPLAKRAAHVDGGQLSVAPTKGAAPQPCEMVEE